MALSGGGAGIRTLGRVTVAGFQDQCFRPLSHPSGRAILAYGCCLLVVAVRVFDLPAPNVVAHSVEVIFGTPIEFPLSLLWISI